MDNKKLHLAHPVILRKTHSGVNSTQGMLLGAGRDSSGNEPDGPFDGQISNSYLIDGQALGPEYFGFMIHSPILGNLKSLT